MKLTLVTHAMSFRTCTLFYHFLDNEVNSEGNTFRKMAITAIPSIQKEPHNYNITGDHIRFYVNMDWLRRTSDKESRYINITSRHPSLRNIDVSSKES